MAKFTNDEALNYHSEGRPGKIQVIPTKPTSTQRDLTLAYSPGVAVPCLEIQKNPEDVYKYTAKGNLVAVISNGTAVLGLGDIGTEAGKPVMEGKGLLFKIFADIDVFDIEVSTKDIDKFVETCKEISPTFGGINLEDIKAPECFEIEDRLKAELDIPVMHDDQHGTAIISGAGLLNALEIVNKKIDEIKVVVNGAGASAISCSRLYKKLGVKPENIIMVDSKGVLNKKRTDLNKSKLEFVTDKDVDTLEQAMVGSDLFLGLSVANVVSKDMVRSMASNPIVFAMANPNPEISYEDAVAAREDVIMATGRSDYPNQINNVLGFPFIFRGALDVRATKINDEMKLAAAYALSALAKQDVPESVTAAYKLTNLTFGRNYIIPKPLDPRLISTIAPAVAKAAMETGVAKHPIKNWEAYKNELNSRLGLDNQLMRSIFEKAKHSPKKVVFADGDNLKVLKAAQTVLHDGIATPVLLGNVPFIKNMIAANKLDLQDVQIVDYRSCDEDDRRKNYAKIAFEKRQRKGFTYKEAYQKFFDPNYFGVMMVETGEADAFISGMTTKYSDTIRPAIQLIGTKSRLNHIAGMYLMMTKKGPFFFSDTTVNIEPTSDTLVDTTLLTADGVMKFDIKPVIAMVSFSNFGSTKDGSPAIVREAVKSLHKNYPELIVDGEMQTNFALNKELRMKLFPFTKLSDKTVNTIIFPGLNSGNIAFKLMQEIGEAEAIGPIILGLKKSVHVLPIECSVREIVNMAAIAVVDAQCCSTPNCSEFFSF